MKDIDDWEFILDTVDALFYGLSNGIASRTNMSLVDSHEQAWVLFEQGCFRLRCGDDDSIGVEPCPWRECRVETISESPVVDVDRVDREAGKASRA
jgi:hypothetical protein